MWHESYRADPRVRPLADRHYNRQKVGAKQFVAPGRCLVLRTPCQRAYWVTSWPFAEYVRHDWAGAWVCSAFRNEGAGLSSTLILHAVAATRAHWSDPDEHGLVTFVDAEQVRHKRDPGRCFLRAGFHEAGRTKGGLVALLLPQAALKFVAPTPAVSSQLSWCWTVPYPEDTPFTAEELAEARRRAAELRTRLGMDDTDPEGTP